MRRLRVLAFSLSLMLVSSVGVSQDYFFASLNNFFQGESIGGYRNAVDTDVALLIRYIGSASDFAQVAVGGAAVDTLTFTQDDTDGTTASTELECPVSGALGGVIDLTDAACDTLGEIVDIINASTGWRVIILDGLRSDVFDGTSGGFLADAADQDCQSIEGDSILVDTSEGATPEWATVAITDLRSMQDYVSNIGAAGVTRKLIPTPFMGKRAAILRVVSLLNQSAAGTVEIYSVLVKNAEAGGSETVTTLHVLATADNTEDDFNWYPYGIMGRKDEKLIIRFIDPGAYTAVTRIAAYGIEWDHR